MNILGYINSKGISNFDIFVYIVIFVLLTTIFTRIIKIEIAHIYIILLLAIIVYFMASSKNEDDTDFNKQMEYKLVSLGDTRITDFMYLDIDLINLCYNLKENYYNYNPKSYNNFLEHTNNVLKIRNDIEKDICISVPEPFLFDNYVDTATKPPICNKILNNATQNFKVAEEQMTLAMNYLESIEISLPTNIDLETNFSILVDRAQLLLKRNIDIMYKKIDAYTYSNKYNYKTSFINYDDPKPFDNSGLETSFNFYS